MGRRYNFRNSMILFGFVFGAWSCSPPTSDAVLHVAAATSLTGVFQDLSIAFEEQSGITVTPSFAATGHLAQQIANGAPYDVFAAADASHIDTLIARGYLNAQSRTTYALGDLVLVQAYDSSYELNKLEQLADTQIDRIAIANPAHAPYGIAAAEALSTAKLWEAVENKLIYGETVKQAAVITATGNADAAIVARSVLDPSLKVVVQIPPDLYSPILHVAAVLTSTTNETLSQSFIAFMISPEGQTILESHGLATP